MKRVVLILLLLNGSVIGPIRPIAADERTTPEAGFQEIERTLETLPPLIESAQSHQRIGFHGHEADPAWVMIDLGDSVTPEKVAIFPARLSAAGAAPSGGFPSALEVEIADAPDFVESVRLASWIEPEPGAAEQISLLCFPGNGASGRYLRVRVTRFHNDPLEPRRRYFRLGEIVVLAEGRNAALGRPVTTTSTTETARRWERRNLTDGYFWCLPLRGAESSIANGYESASHKRPVVDDQVWVEVDLEASQALDEIHIVPAHPRDFADLPGYGFPTHFRVLADAGTSDEKELLVELAPRYPGEALPNPGAAQLMLSVPGLSARRVRVTCQALWRRGPSGGLAVAEFFFALGELQLWRRGKNVAAGRPVQWADATTKAGWSPAALVDGRSSRHELLDWKTWLDGLERAEALRIEARSLGVEIERRRESRRRQLLLGAAAAIVVVLLIAIASVLWLRMRATRMQSDLQTRIARDLHDEIGASLSHLAIQSDLARRQLAQGELKPERLDGIAATARETLDQMRDVIWLLAPKFDDWSELSQRIESIVDRLLDGIEHQLDVEGHPPDGKPAIEWSRDLLAFLKEALTNVRKHAAAVHVRITILWSNRFTLRIEDDGRGFDPAVASRSGGAGMDNLKRRAAALGGECDVSARPGTGTTVRLSAPIVTE